MWQAHQEMLGRSVAVKIDDRHLDTPGERRRFVGEAEAAGRLSGHPGIVSVHDSGILPDGRPYLIMELFPAGSLTTWVEADQRPSVEQVREVGVQIGQALAAAHAQGLLHRDVKPANILLDSYGRFGLADFGLTALDPEVEGGSAPMTPAYAPLEVIRRRPPSAAGDVYQLAATLYALLAGEPPRPVDTATPSYEQLERLHDEPVRPLPEVDPALMQVIMAGLDPDPAARPTAAEFADRLAALPLGTAAAARPGRTRRRVLAVLASVLAAIVLIGLGGGALYAYQIDRSLTSNITRELELPPGTTTGRPAKDPAATAALNYVLIGTDQGDPSEDRHGRSDSIMVLHLNGARDRAYILSFPRDLWVSIPGYGKNTINAAFALGGASLVVETVEGLTGTRMDHVAMIDFEGFISLTEDLGGVTVNNRVAFRSHGFDFPRGQITLRGEEALWFVRERNSLPSESQRTEHQRQMLKAILAKGVSTEVITDPVRFTTFVANAAKRIRVDNALTNAEIRSTMISLRLRPSAIQLMSAPLGRAERIDGRWVRLPDEGKLGALGTSLRTDTMEEYVKQ